MDYKEKYEQALERAKSAIKECGNNQGRIAMIESIFPELKESEDEKIRKEIVSAINLYCSEYHRGTKVKNDMLAWLEKQGEHKSAEFNDTNAKRMFIKALERVEEQNAKGYKLTDCDKNSWWEDFKTYASCTIEQKPAWSESDENKITYLDDLVDYQSCMSNDEKKDFHRWLKSLKNRVQPKQEWSEEDESYLNTTIAYLKDAKEFKKTAENCINWLKSLRPQPKQKWSQDDNDFADDAIACVTRCYENYIDNKEFYQSLRHNTMDIKRWLIDVRKRLTPHWKPSEKQMDALDRAQAELCETKYNKPICDLIDSLKELIK